MNKIRFLIDKEKFIKDIYPKKCVGYDYIPSIFPSVERIIVLGDIHGDYNLFIKLLTLSKVITLTKHKNYYKWIGKNTFVVQIGDQIDRCRPKIGEKCEDDNVTFNDEASDIRILDLANRLHKQAIKDGGAVISLLGNHEIMNVKGNLKYVSRLGLKEFENYVDPITKQTFKDGKEGRQHAFLPGNEIGKLLGCSRLSSVIIGSHIFVHAGIVDGLITQMGIDEINDLEIINIAIRMWLLGMVKDETELKKFIEKITDGTETSGIPNKSIFWTRLLGKIPPNTKFSDPQCMNHVSNALNILKVGKMIIGHTPQSFMYSNGINNTCDETIWRVDNGSSKAFIGFDKNFTTNGKISEGRLPQVLEIINDKIYNIIK